jgi:hypothetical protein
LLSKIAVAFGCAAPASASPNNPVSIHPSRIRVPPELYPASPSLLASRS